MNKSRIVRAALFGAGAGIVNFVIQEPRARFLELAHARAATTLLNVFAESTLIFAILGLLVSVAIVFSDELGSMLPLRIFTRSCVALIAGALGGGLAGFVGQGIFSFILGVGSTSAVVVARTLGWAAVGAGIGLAGGLPSGSLRRCLQGIVGGFVGGGVGGVVFDVVSIPFGAGTVSRLIGDTVIGGAVGTAVMLVEEVAKVAWITVVAGRNEGRQYILSKPVMVIGRDELADIPLFGDFSVGKHHAQIRTADWRTFVLRDLGSPTGTLVNGARVVEKPLSDGDSIQIGSFQLVFNQRAGVTGPEVASQKTSSSTVSVPEAERVCPFCGSARDPVTGNCACTPVPAGVGQEVCGRPCLVGVAGPYSGSEFQLQADRTEIGRDPSNAIVLEKDLTVSRKHAAIIRQGDTYLVQDLGSTNGIYVNGARVHSAKLHPGDTLRLGNSVFSFH
ncbi:MAG: FHA domain-containing protein [Armatimonadota bacterium]